MTGLSQSVKTGIFKRPWSKLKLALNRRRPAPLHFALSSPEKRPVSSSELISPKFPPAEIVSPIPFDTPPVESDHNEKLAISRLPPEILAEMFILLCETSDYFDYSWVACSHVCSSWRQITLDLPHLWSHVVFSSPEWTRLCLDRSKTSLLIIEADVTSSFVQHDLVCDVLELADRIGRIDIRFVILSDRLLALLAGPLPMLTSMTLESTSYVVSRDIPLKPDPPSYPKLRTLQVRSNVPFLPPLPAQLVNLEIINPDMDMETDYLGWDNFAEALQLLPQLEILTLRGFPVPSPSSSRLRICLPSLRRLNLSATPADCTQFIQTLEFPPTQSCDLNLGNVSDIGAMFETVLSKLGNPPKSMFLQRKYGQTITPNRPTLNHTDVGFFQHLIFGFANENARDRRVAMSDICFGWMYSLTDNELAEIFVAISGIDLIASIQWFWLVDWNISPQGTWGALLRRLIRLQTLVISGLPATGLLWDLLKEVESSPGRVALLPELVEVEVNNVDCSAGGFLTRRPHDNPVNSYFDLDGARFVEVLVCYLELRPTKLSKLKISKCHGYTAAEIKLFRLLVGDVQWDGVGSILPSYFPNGDEFSAFTINHNLLSHRPGYEELNLSDEERWRRQNWAHWG
ncbi:hypothetical protein C8R44DRAFT_786403 [Mycena epipterygia]|nr:hypothetical protein C8R44DRAFT_786403 [Mycena epipterygia]